MSLDVIQAKVCDKNKPPLAATSLAVRAVRPTICLSLNGVLDAVVSDISSKYREIMSTTTGLQCSGRESVRNHCIVCYFPPSACVHATWMMSIS